MTQQEAPTETEIFTAIAEETQLARKQLASVFTALADQIEEPKRLAAPS